LTSRPAVIFSDPVGNAPDSVKRLVDHFDQNRKVFVSPDYKEEQLRLEYLNPLFSALGWDVYNRAGLSETFKQVIHEESIKVTGATKAPDCTFRMIAPVAAKGRERES